MLQRRSLQEGPLRTVKHRQRVYRRRAGVEGPPQVEVGEERLQAEEVRIPRKKYQ